MVVLRIEKRRKKNSNKIDNRMTTIAAIYKTGVESGRLAVGHVFRLIHAFHGVHRLLSICRRRSAGRTTWVARPWFVAHTADEIGREIIS